MKKYTIEEFKQGKKAVWVETTEQWNKLNEVCKLTNLGHYPRYYTNGGGFLDFTQKEDGIKWGSKYGLLTLDFSQLVFEDEFPEKWAFELNDENYREIKHLRPISGTMYGFITSRRYCDLDWGIWEGRIPNGYKLISFNQFKEHVLKQPKMEKEIIGYKFKDDCKIYNHAASVIVGTCSLLGENLLKNGCSFTGTSPYVSKAHKAGVLDLWFEPVYREDKKLPVINGKEGSYKKGSGIFKYGCTDFEISEVKRLHGSASTLNIWAVVLKDQGPVEVNQIGEILDYIKFVNEQ
jgi:hypothetical protein